MAAEAAHLGLRGAAFEAGAASAVAAFHPYDKVDAGDWPAWGETRRPRPGPAGHVPFAIRGDGEVRTPEIDLSTHENYRGAMTQLTLILPPAKGIAKVYAVGFSRDDLE